MVYCKKIPKNPVENSLLKIKNLYICYPATLHIVCGVVFFLSAVKR